MTVTRRSRPAVDVVADQLDDLVTASPSLIAGLRVLRAAVADALMGGVPAQRVDKGLGRVGRSGDGGVLWDLVKNAGGPVGVGNHKSLPARGQLAAAVDTAALQFRMLVVDQALTSARLATDQWLEGFTKRAEAIGKCSAALAAEVEYVMRHVPRGASVYTRSGTDLVWRDLSDLRMQPADADRAALAKYLAVSGASQREIAKAFGRLGSEYGYRPTLDAWRTFGKPAVAAQGKKTDSLVAAAVLLSEADGRSTRLADELLKLRDPCWLDVETPGVHVIGRRPVIRNIYRG